MKIQISLSRLRNAFLCFHRARQQQRSLARAARGGSAGVAIAAGLMRPSTRLASAHPCLHNQTDLPHCDERSPLQSLLPPLPALLRNRICERSAGAYHLASDWRVSVTWRNREMSRPSRANCVCILQPCVHSYVTQSISATLH